MRYNEAMFPENDPKVEFLKQVFLFNEFDEDGLAQVAARLNSEFVQAGEVIFSEGDQWDNVYFVNSGEVRVTRKGEEGEETFLAIFDSGDTFGEGGPLFKRKRSATITAISDTNLYSLNEADFDWVRSTYPQITPYLVAFTRTHETVRKLNIDWLNEEETISLAARRHPIRLIVEVGVILFLVVLTTLLSTLLITFLSNVRLITLLTLGVTGTVTLLGLVGIAWAILEWRNDYFFIT
ncbi:MAG: cyclic nucleotide-binding domain-containing protein, partial [Anaerolineales bacterium]|nr:cyclic nucleotide-binding domain-containing protein [Anaerolineales bacterium]